MTGRRFTAIGVALLAIGGGLLLWLRHASRPITVTEGKFPEQLVYVRSADDIVDAGAMFTAPKTLAKPVAIIWIHGWGANFYYPTYTNIGRALAARGYTTITANTRMHDLANVAGERYGQRIRAGGYWGVASEQTSDLAAWIDFAESLGFRNVVLVGHSAGWAAVRAYQAEKQDTRVVGLVSASGQIYPNDPPDPKMLAEAARLVADHRGDELLRFPAQHRSYPSYVSASTYLDIAKTPPQLMDFYGIRTPNPAVTRIRCPLLAWFGTRDDVGTAKDLEKLKSSIQHQSSRPSRVETVLIKNADHMYTGEETQVAETIAQWASTLLLGSAGQRALTGIVQTPKRPTSRVPSAASN